jgi:miniconductance mechanosensitive channel
MGESLRKLFELISDWMHTWGLTGPSGQILHVTILMILLIALGFLIDRLTRWILTAIIHRVVKKTSSRFDDVMLEKGVFKRLSNLVPALIVFYMIPHVFQGVYPESTDTVLNQMIVQWIAIFRDITSAYMIIIGMLVVFGVFDAGNKLYDESDISGRVPIRGYIQLVKVILVFIAVVWIFSLIFNFRLKGFFTGLGAFMAVLTLVFKDTLLGLVASIQLSVNRLIRIGDWVTIPSRNADGVIQDITVTVVKVENFDKTIITFPTYALVSEPVQNWRGMEESRGRRIKRSINIDMATVHFCSEEQLDKLEEIMLIRDYIQTKRREFAERNREVGAENSNPANGIRLTNIGIFRIYLEHYLVNEPRIHADMTFMVRQLQPTDKGIPLEVYAFSMVTAWEVYEKIQADIFDHILAVLPQFGLKVFQNPTGFDFRQLASKT